MKIRHHKLLRNGSLLLLLFLSIPIAQAEDFVSSPTSDMQEQVQFWQKLKKEDPNKFNQLVSARKKEVKERLAKLRTEDPEQFHRTKEQMKSRRKERLNKVKKENPARFEQIMQRKAQKFKDWHEKNPDKSQRFLDRNPNFKKNLAREGFFENRSDEPPARRQNNLPRREVDFKRMKDTGDFKKPLNSEFRERKQHMDAELLKHESPVRYNQFMKHNPKLDQRVRERTSMKRNDRARNAPQLRRNEGSRRKLASYG